MRVALTLDDGPSEWTDPILDLLAAHQARATFFVVGANITAHKLIVWRAHEKGHEIGNHTFWHNRATGLTDTALRAELAMTSSLIEDATGRLPVLWRAPHFDHDDRTDAIATDLGLRHVGCDIDPGDWNERDPERIAARVLDRLGDGCIVDLHDGVPPDGGNGTKTRAPTVDAVQLILQTPDVEFVTVSEL